jgi:hypothetical protein
MVRSSWIGCNGGIDSLVRCCSDFLKGRQLEPPPKLGGQVAWSGTNTTVVVIRSGLTVGDPIYAKFLIACVMASCVLPVASDTRCVVLRSRDMS